MIAFLAGSLAAKTPGLAVVDVHGVGYAVHVPLSTYNRLGEVGSPVRLLTYLAIRENAQDLYGFLTAGERDLFERLIDVNGVGPKLGLSVLSATEPAGFRRAVLTGDVKALSRIPGVGKKTAERLIMELGDSFQAKGELAELGLPGSGAGAMSDSRTEAVLALVSLGFRQPDAAQAVRKAVASLGQGATTESLLKEALRKV